MMLLTSAHQLYLVDTLTSSVLGEKLVSLSACCPPAVLEVITESPSQRWVAWGASAIPLALCSTGWLFSKLQAESFLITWLSILVLVKLTAAQVFT